MAGAGADSAFPPESDSAGASAYGAFRDRAVVGFLHGAGNIGGFHVEAANVVEPAVIGFADKRVGARDAFISGFSDSPVGDGGGGVKNAEGVGQDDGSLDLAELVDLS